MYVESCTILVVVIVYREPSWYLTDYRVYMGSSMTVRPLAGCHRTCTLINWSVLRLPAVTSSRYDLLDLAHRLHHLAGPIVDASDDGGGHGCSARRDDGGTPVTTSAAPTKARTSIAGLQGTYCACSRGLQRSG